MAVATFQIFNADGSLHLDLSFGMPRYLGTITIGTNSGVRSGDIYHAEFANGKPFVLPRSWASNQPGGAPDFYFYSDRIHWQYRDSPVPITLDYGVY